MPFNPDQPYNDLPDLPPPADIESKPLLKACIEARAALAELKSAGDSIPNQAVLINTIPLLEAQASSEIENIVTTSDALFRYAQLETQADDPATKEALRYRVALNRGFESLKKHPINTNTATRICSSLKDLTMEVRRVPGTALANAATGKVIYTPPQGESLLRRKLANWERFIHDAADIDPLIRMAVAHYQFEAIHPFLDGNGRTGRILNLLILVEQGILDLPVLYLSRYFLRNRTDYYQNLLAVTRDEAWEAWVAFMLAAVTDTARWTTAKIQAIQQLQAQALAFVKIRAGKIYSRELVDLLFAQPYCRIQNLVEADIAKRQTASVYLKRLASLGMLSETKVGREKLFIHPNFVRLLTSEGHPVLLTAKVQSTVTLSRERQHVGYRKPTIPAIEVRAASASSRGYTFHGLAREPGKTRERPNGTYFGGSGPIVAPAKAGAQYEYTSRLRAGFHYFYWIPAFAGMTGIVGDIG